MVARGVHFALTDRQRQTLEAKPNDRARIDFVQCEIEARWETAFLQETDHAWQVIHACLTDWPTDRQGFYPTKNGDPYILPEDLGSYPLKLCVLGGKRLIQDESQYVIRLIEPREVSDLAPALAAIDRDWMRAKYVQYCAESIPEFGPTDFDYSWTWFEALRAFFKRMAGNGRSIVFTTDQ